MTITSTYKTKKAKCSPSSANHAMTDTNNLLLIHSRSYQKVN